MKTLEEIRREGRVPAEPTPQVKGGGQDWEGEKEKEDWVFGAMIRPL